MRSEGNVYNPVPERIPKVRNADEFKRMKTRYENPEPRLLCQLIHLELRSLLVISGCISHFSYLPILALAEITLSE